MTICKMPKILVSGFIMSILVFLLTSNTIMTKTQEYEGDLLFDFKFSLASSTARAYEIIHDVLVEVGEMLSINVVCKNCGDEHITSACTAESISKSAIGTFSIPDLGLEVNCYNSSAQFVCDAKNSACFFPLESQMIIADHWYQGFHAIKFCEKGTIAYFETNSGIQKYICTGVIKGHNKVSDLTDRNGKSIADMNPGGITCYTCNYSWENVTIVFFQPAQ